MGDNRLRSAAGRAAIAQKGQGGMYNMTLNFKRSLLGFKPAAVRSEIYRLLHESDDRVTYMHDELERVTKQLKEADEKIIKLQAQLQQLHAREHLIAELIINAELTARNIVEQGRAQAEAIILDAEARKTEILQELELLHSRMDNFKKEFRGLINHHLHSLDTFEIRGEVAETKSTLMIEMEAAAH